MPQGGSYRSIHDDNSFEVFLESWLIRQEQFLNELIIAQYTFDEESKEGDYIRDFITRVLAHYQEYYEQKSRMTRTNVFRVFSPTWFSPLERTFLWIAEFNLGLAFNLVTDSINDLSEHQVQRINWLRHETKAREKFLTEELANIQESAASPPFAELACRVGMQLLYSTNVEIADMGRLRTKTAERVVELLNPLQCLKFLGAAAQLQLRVRMMGMQREAERQQ